MTWNGIDVNDELTAQYLIAEREKREALAERARSGYTNPVESMTADQIREAYERSAAEKESAAAAERQRQAALTFVAEEPSYIQNQTNATRLTQYLESAGFDGSSPEHFHAAFNELNRAGLLRVKPTPAQPRPRYTPQDLYNIPMHELEELATKDPDGMQFVGRISDERGHIREVRRRAR